MTTAERRHATNRPANPRGLRAVPSQARNSAQRSRARSALLRRAFLFATRRRRICAHYRRRILLQRGDERRNRLRRSDLSELPRRLGARVRISVVGEGLLELLRIGRNERDADRERQEEGREHSHGILLRVGANDSDRFRSDPRGHRRRHHGCCLTYERYWPYRFCSSSARVSLPVLRCAAMTRTSKSRLLGATLSAASYSWAASGNKPVSS